MKILMPTIVVKTMIEHRVTASFNKGVKVDAELTFVSRTISSFYIP